jgi:hypothetical protein
MMSKEAQLYWLLRLLPMASLLTLCAVICWQFVQSESATAAPRLSVRHEYDLGWYSNEIDSSDFHEISKRNVNPKMPFQGAKYKAKSVELGVFGLSSGLIQMIGGDTALPVTEELLANISPEFDGKFQVQGGILYVRPHHANTTEVPDAVEPGTTEAPPPTSSSPTSETATPNPPTSDPSFDDLNLESAEDPQGIQRSETPRVADSADTIVDPELADQPTETAPGNTDELAEPSGVVPAKVDVDDPQIGDLKVVFAITPNAQIVSVIAAQNGSELGPFETKYRSYQDLDMGKVDSVTMFERQKSETNLKLWLLRLLGVILSVIGVRIAFTAVTGFTDAIPFLGTMLGWGATLGAVVIGIPLALLTIAVAWVIVRPLVGILMLVVVIGLFVLAIYFLRSARRDKTEMA